MGQVLVLPTRSMTSLLWQDEVWWPSGTESVVRLEDMTPSHRLNLAKWLKRNAQTIVWNEWIKLDSLIDGEMSDGVWNALSNESGWLERYAMPNEPGGRPSIEYIRTTPLWKRLNQLIRRDFAIARSRPDPLEPTF